MIEFQTKGKIRNLPLSQDYQTRLQAIVSGIDPTLGIRVVSGGQARKGTPGRRTGSTRHDVNENGTADTSDFVLTRNGEALLPNDHKDLYAQLIERASPHYAGIGHYPWGVHIGVGNPSFWGPNTKANSADPDLKAAYDRGRAKLGASPHAQGAVDRAHLADALLGGSPFSQANPTFTSSETERRTEIDNERSAPSTLEAANMARNEQWVGSVALDAMERSGKFKPDHTFRMDNDLWDELTQDLPEQYWPMFEDAHSRDHALDLRARALELQKIDDTLGVMGTEGLVLRIGAAVTDPVGLAAGVLSGGAATAARAGRLVNILRAGTAGAAVNAGLEGVLVANNPNMTNTDLMLAAGFGFVLGGAGGALATRSPVDNALSPSARSLIREIQDGAGQSIGAARNPDYEDFSTLSAAQKRDRLSAAAPESAFDALRFDMVGNLKASSSPITRRLAGLFAEDGVGNRNLSALEHSASERVTLDMKRDMTQFYRVGDTEQKAWMRARGLSAWKRRFYNEEFYTEVGKAVRRAPGEYTQNPHVNKVADKIRDLQNRLLKFAKDKELAGFSEVLDNPQYLMRKFNHQSIDRIISETSEAAVRRVITGSIRSASPHISLEDAQKVAAGYLNTVRQSKYDDITLARMFDADQTETLSDMLRGNTDMTPEEIDRVVNVVAPSTPASGTISRAKRRLGLDETYQDPTTGIRFEDLLDNNAERLFTGYARQIRGAGHMEDALRQFALEDGSVPSFETLKQNIRSTAGENGMTKRQLDDEISKLETLHAAVTGRPLTPDNRVGQALRWLRDLNFVRVMNQVGFAQIAEIGNILGTAGWRASLQSMPTLRKIYSRAQDGSMSDELLDELEVIWGLGTDRLRHSFTNRMDDFGVPEAQRTGEQFLDHAKALTADISLMAPVNMALQRMAGRAAVQRFMNMAVDGSEMSDARLGSLGLNREMFERISQQMNTHVAEREGILGRSVKRINIDEWDDQDAASAFIAGIDKWTRRVIQENDVGLMSQWMTTDLGKVMMQFRTFMVGAWVKQTLHGMHTRDINTFQAWGASMLFAGLSYTAQTYINSVGRDDQSDFLKTRLSAEEVGKASFQRAAFASMIPAALDTVVTLPGYDPVFAYGRSTGLASGALGNPTLDLLDNATAAVGGAIGALREDRNYSQQDARAATSILPWQNAMGIRNTLNLITQDLPRFSER